jgi:hypothetical protein
MPQTVYRHTWGSLGGGHVTAGPDAEGLPWSFGAGSRCGSVRIFAHTAIVIGSSTNQTSVLTAWRGVIMCQTRFLPGSGPPH